MQRDQEKLDFKRGYDLAMEMLDSDPAGFKAFIEGAPKGTKYYEGLTAGAKDHSKYAGAKDHAFSVEKNFQKGFNIGYWLEKGDPKAAKAFLESLKNKDNSAYHGYVAGMKQAQKERFKERLMNINSKAKDYQQNKDDLDI